MDMSKDEQLKYVVDRAIFMVRIDLQAYRDY